MSRIHYSISVVIAAAALVYSANGDAALNDDLFRAIQKNDSAAVKALLRRGAEVNAKDENEATPLMRAAIYGDPGLMKVLLDKGADPNAHNKVGATALLWSVHDIRKVRLLTGKGANVNARSEGGKTPLLLAAYYSDGAATVKLLLEKGAELGAKDNRGAGLLLFAVEGGDLDTIRLLLDKGVDVNAGATGEFNEIRFGNLGPPPGYEPQKGVTALMVAASTNDAAAAKLLLDRGAQVNAKASDGVTALLATAIRGGAPLIKALVEKGADVNVTDPQGRTPLILLGGCDDAEPETVRLLLDKGARVDVKDKTGLDALAWARQRGDTPMVKMLKDAGAKDAASAVTVAAEAAGGFGLRQAVEKALSTLQAAGPPVVKQRGCISCHNQSIPAMAVAVARQKGFAVNEQIARQELKGAVAVLGPHRENLLQHIGSVPFTPEVGSYALLGMAAEKYPADRITDALVHDIAQKQRRDGSWLMGDLRPPIEQSDFSSTALCLRSLQLYPIAGRREEFQRRIAKARAWLLANRTTRSNEGRAFRLLGLAWAKADTQDAIRDLLAAQRPNGGWAGLATLDPDAYATGQALFALQEAGVRVSDPSYQRGVNYLLNTQLKDGSWHVRTRAMGFQPYFESGFPHGHDQWISAAGTAWAIMALAPAAEPAKTAAARIKPEFP